MMYKYLFLSIAFTLQAARVTEGSLPLTGDREKDSVVKEMFEQIQKLEKEVEGLVATQSGDGGFFSDNESDNEGDFGGDSESDEESDFFDEGDFDSSDKDSSSSTI